MSAPAPKVPPNNPEEYPRLAKVFASATP